MGAGESDIMIRIDLGGEVEGLGRAWGVIASHRWRLEGIVSAGAGSGLSIKRGVSGREVDIILAIEIWDSTSMSFVGISRYSASVLFRRCQTARIHRFAA
jgi:hypothetical protein